MGAGTDQQEPNHVIYDDDLNINWIIINIELIK